MESPRFQQIGFWRSMKPFMAWTTSRMLARPLWTVFVTALVVRLCVVALVALFADGYLFQDDHGYLQLAEQHTDRSELWDAGSQRFWKTNLSFLAPISFLFDVVGPYPALAQSLQALAGAWTATCVTMLVGRHARPGISLGAGMVAALYPSQVLWSSLVLKDALVWMCLATIAVVIARWQESGDRVPFAIGSTGLLLLLLYLSHLRAHTLVTTCLALVVSVSWRPSPLRLARIVIALLFLLLIPLTVDAGLGGNRLWRIGLFGMEEQRQAGAVGAATALVEIPAHTQLSLAQERVAALEAELKLAREDLENWIDQVESTIPSTDYVYAQLSLAQERVAALEAELKLAREDLENWIDQVESTIPSTITDDLLYLPTGIRVMLVDPLPQHLGNNRNLILAFSEHLIWYPALLLCLLGLPSALRGSAELTFSSFVALGLLVMWALVEGNFGTAFRHKGEFVWAVLVFAGVGAEQLARRRSSLAERLQHSGSPNCSHLTTEPT
jgi:hypothetical protein